MKNASVTEQEQWKKFCTWHMLCLRNAYEYTPSTTLGHEASCGLMHIGQRHCASLQGSLAQLRAIPSLNYAGCSQAISVSAV